MTKKNNPIKNMRTLKNFGGGKKKKNSPFSNEQNYIKLKDILQEIYNNDNIKYVIETNKHFKGRVPNYVIDKYSVDKAIALFDSCGAFDRNFINLVFDNIYYLVYLVRGIIRSCFNTWSLRYNWNAIDEDTKTINDFCNINENTYTPIIHALLFIGDCREHGYLTAFLFNIYLIHLEKKHNKRFLNYEMVIYYCTFYIPETKDIGSYYEQTKDNKKPYILNMNFKNYDHVFNGLIGGNTYEIIDSLDITSDFHSENPPVWNNLHLHNIKLSDVSMFEEHKISVKNITTNADRLMVIKGAFGEINQPTFIIASRVPFIDKVKPINITEDIKITKYLCIDTEINFDNEINGRLSIIRKNNNLFEEKFGSPSIVFTQIQSPSFFNSLIRQYFYCLKNKLINEMPYKLLDFILNKQSITV